MMAMQCSWLHPHALGVAKATGASPECAILELQAEATARCINVPRLVLEKTMRGCYGRPAGVEAGSRGGGQRTREIV
jgi:hypothetical protein